MPNIFINDTHATEGGFSRDFDQKTGWVSKRHYEGTQATILALEIQAISLGYNTSITQGAVWKLDINIPAKDDGNNGGQGEQPVDTWELFPNVIEKDLLQSDSTPIKKLSKQHVAFMRDVLDGKIAANKYATADPAEFATNVGVGSNPVGVFRLILSGWKSKRIYQRNLRHTRTISNSYQVPASLLHVGDIYPTDVLIGAETIPPLISGSLLPSIYFDRDDGVAIFSGWLKGHPTITSAAFGKAQITQEWEWGEWPSLAYTVVL